MIGVISYALFAGMSGYLEAYFWNEYPYVSQRWSHIMLTVFRTIVMFPVFWYEGWISCVSLSLMFPLIHDGVYYETRNMLNPNLYPLGWMDRSTKSGAMISLGFGARLLFAIIGIIILILC